jgi:hypothetical protein
VLSHSVPPKISVSLFLARLVRFYPVVVYKPVLGGF